MKTEFFKIKTALSFGFLALTSSTLFAENIIATKVNSSFEGIENSNIIKDLKFTEIAVYPQKTIVLNDKSVAEKNSQNIFKIIKVSAIYNDSDIAFVIKWQDGTLSIQDGYKTDIYGDGFAVQFPKDYSDPKKLPYIGMGSENREVLVHLQKAVPNVYEPNGNGNVELQMNRENTNYFGEELKQFYQNISNLARIDYQKSFVSAGFRSLTEIKDDSAKVDMNMVYNHNYGCWKGTLSRKLKDEYINLNSPSFPVAFAIWDGDKNNRGGTKLLSSWQTVTLDGKTGGEVLVSEINNIQTGNLENGKAQFEANCIACHIAGEIKSAMPFMAPDLTNIGGYANSAYIRESIIDPNAVIVPGYNRNAHKNFEWYQIVDGKRISTMPSFSWLDENITNDIVSYVQTLKTQIKEEKK